MISTIIILKIGKGEKAQLLFTDTDGLCYEIETEDIYRELWTCLTIVIIPKRAYLLAQRTRKLLVK